MILRVKNQFQKRKEDNKGAALVLVIVAIAFIGMLVAMILYATYNNYLMKNSDRLAKDNFYTAEYALGVINAGIQQDVSEAMSKAYVETMQYSLGQTPDAMTFSFRDSYIDELVKKLHHAEGGVIDDTKWSLSHLRQMWTDNGVPTAATPGSFGAYLDIQDGGANTLIVSTNNDYLTLYDLKVVYTDDKGYVSIITTDIRVKVPSIDFAQAAMRLNLENYSIIANDSLVNGNDGVASEVTGVNKGSDVTITGNVFGGYKGVQNIGQRITRFEIDPIDEAAGGTNNYNLVAELIEVSNAIESGSGVYVDEHYSTYVNDINLSTARLDVAGDMYVGDDMDVAGRGSIVRLSGKYRGYGRNEFGDSEGSSSILINGADTTLDFSGLDELILSGHAYVGAKKYDADKDRLLYITEDEEEKAAVADSDVVGESADYSKLTETVPEGEEGFQETENTIPQNKNDIRMGESVSVKANQLLYLVPVDCIGYDVRTNEQVITQNPMRYEDYRMLTETKQEKKDATGTVITDGQGEAVMENVYEPVRLATLWNRLGGVAYTNNYRAVYRRVNGSVLVYLYLDFSGDEDMANAFFNAYYDYDKEGIERYVSSYIKTLNWGTALNEEANLTLAGNAFKYDADGDLQLVDDSLDDADKSLNMLNMKENYSNIYESLMHTLSTNYSNMTSAQQGSEIFETMVDQAKLEQLKGLDFVNAAAGISARIFKDDVVYPSTGCPEDTKLIVTSGNVYVTKNFEGLIVAGGNVYVCDDCAEIRYSPAKVLQAMQATYTTGGTEMYAYEVFGESGRITYGVVEDSGTGQEIELRDLITYQNWKKE